MHHASLALSIVYICSEYVYQGKTAAQREDNKYRALVNRKSSFKTIENDIFFICIVHKLGYSSSIFTVRLANFSQDNIRKLGQLIGKSLKRV